VDIVRAPRPKRGRYIAIAAGIVTIVGVSVALTRLEPAAPSVERGTLWIDTVKRGTMVRQVRAPGTLVPEHVRIITALTAGRIEQKLANAGQAVQANTPLLDMSNPDVQLQALEADRSLSAAEANLVSLRSQLATQRMQQKATIATITSQYNDAKRNAEVFDALDKKGMSSANEVARARDQMTELAARRQIEMDRLNLLERTIGEQLKLEQANVDRLRGIAQFQHDRVTSMHVTAGEPGVLQDLTLELGQWVQAGAPLARVAQPGKLKAVLRVPETQAKDIVIGQPVSIDTRNGLVSGTVSRVDPSASAGTVTVEVHLDGELPKGARSDISVDGTIEIERLNDVVYVGRPAYGQAESTVGLFKLTPDGKTATRVQVKLGVGSVSTVQVLQGLVPGDKVIISDVSQWDSQDRLRIK
jgi:multidrug efflux pump subunit AcrA (membrane-fusion protein)